MVPERRRVSRWLAARSVAGLAVVPLFAGYDTSATDSDRAGRIVSYDVTGGRYEESQGYQAVGSGSLRAGGGAGARAGSFGSRRAFSRSARNFSSSARARRRIRSASPR